MKYRNFPIGTKIYTSTYYLPARGYGEFWTKISGDRWQWSGDGRIEDTPRGIIAKIERPNKKPRFWGQE